MKSRKWAEKAVHPREDIFIYSWSEKKEEGRLTEVVARHQEDHWMRDLFPGSRMRT